VIEKRKLGKMEVMATSIGLPRRICGQKEISKLQLRIKKGEF